MVLPSSGVFYWTQVSPGSDLTDLTLADQTNSLQTDNANNAIQGNMAMQVTQPGEQLWNLSINASGAP